MAKWSPVLEAMLRSDCRETQQGEIEIRGHDDITVKTFIKYLYQGSLDPKRYTLELLRIADQYQVLHIQVSNVKSQAIVSFIRDRSAFFLFNSFSARAFGLAETLSFEFVA